MTNWSSFCYDASLIVSSDKVQRMEHIFQFFSDEESDEALTEEFLPGEERSLKVRLDKWLWAARFFKTRAVARAAVEKGKVFYNGQRSKPSREIEIGALLQIRQGRYEKTVIVKGLSTRRRSTEEALQLFEETEESRTTREQMAEWSPPSFYDNSSERNEAHPHQSSYFYPSEQPKERRPVRFLRRSLGRGDQPSRQDKISVYPQHSKQAEFETFE
jgi:ribosome-associated heat shock protein Hsp15